MHASDMPAAATHETQVGLRTEQSRERAAAHMQVSTPLVCGLIDTRFEQKSAKLQ